MSSEPRASARVTKLPIAVQNAKWFPDGKRIAFLAATWPDLNDDWAAVRKRADEQKNDKVQAKIGDTRLLRYWDSYRTDGRRNHVFAVDLASGKVVAPRFKGAPALPTPARGQLKSQQCWIDYVL